MLEVPFNGFGCVAQAMAAWQPFSGGREHAQASAFPPLSTRLSHFVKALTLVSEGLNVIHLVLHLFSGKSSFQSLAPSCQIVAAA